jgi:hypothetical protein
MVVAAYNVPALGDVPLVLNMSVIADIYLGNVARWNDSKIEELNPELVGLLPSTEIMVLVLNEPSEITRLFTGALAKAVPGWSDAVRREETHDGGWLHCANGLLIGASPCAPCAPGRCERSGYVPGERSERPNGRRHCSDAADHAEVD